MPFYKICKKYKATSVIFIITFYIYRKHVYFMRQLSANQNHVYPGYSGNLACSIPNLNQLVSNIAIMMTSLCFC